MSLLGRSPRLTCVLKLLPLAAIARLQLTESARPSGGGRRAYRHNGHEHVAMMRESLRLVLRLGVSLEACGDAFKPPTVEYDGGHVPIQIVEVATLEFVSRSPPRSPEMSGPEDLRLDCLCTVRVARKWNVLANGYDRLRNGDLARCASCRNIALQHDGGLNGVQPARVDAHRSTTRADLRLVIDP